jgi:hypothetical protein
MNSNDLFSFKVAVPPPSTASPHVGGDMFGLKVAVPPSGTAASRVGKGVFGFKVAAPPPGTTSIPDSAWEWGQRAPSLAEAAPLAEAYTSYPVPEEVLFLI